MNGYMGRILRVDLTTLTCKDEALPESLLRQYIGGVGLGAYYLYTETDNNTDPLGPDNRLIFMTGPFTLSGIPSSGRHAIVSKSPLTGIWGEADIGGSWGLGLKRAGYDGVIVMGKAAKPTYIVVEQGKASLHDATELWGSDTYETDEYLKNIYGPTVVTHSIGQAGENQIPIAAIMSDGKSARAAARCGLGAVMGSKLLKAIIVKGTLKIDIDQPEQLKKEVKEIASYQVANRGGMHEHGTAEGLIGNELSGDLPIKNWKLGAWERKSEKISGEVMTDKFLTKRYHCGNCVVGCGREISITEGDYEGVEGAGPEYETIGMLGSNLMIDNLEAICKANERCNRYGIDTISLGGIVGFAMECYEHGLITKEDTGGIALEWGSESALLDLIDMIVNRDQIGAILAEGVRSAANVLGGLAKEFAIEVKGLELPAHEPRVLNGTALSYATSNRGACHSADIGSRFYERTLSMPEIGHMKPCGTLSVEGKGQLIARLQNVDGLFDSLKACTFMVWFGFEPTKMLHWLNLVTGWNMKMDEFLQTGERIFNIRRMYNTREGISRKDDTLPPRILYAPRGEGGDGDHVPPLNMMLSDYYEERGWDEFGIPKPETLKRLSLSDLRRS